MIGTAPERETAHVRTRRICRTHSTESLFAASTIDKYASSSRRRGVTVSTAMPALTGARRSPNA